MNKKMKIIDVPKILNPHTIILLDKGNSVSILSSKVASALRVLEKISAPRFALGSIFPQKPCMTRHGIEKTPNKITVCLQTLNLF